ncbi:MAG: hypothetical protein EPN26_07825 [Rhodospirillales bacterium]|nr:MAG: hypothetical protein EPN26_07825 [Rhodospirillales bacterium]
MTIRDSKGPVSLGNLLGKGGEGAVYEIAGSSDHVAKIYHHPATPERAAKIEAMISLKNDRLLSLAAWPLDILRSPQGQPMGLVMPKVGGHKDIHTLYSPRSRKVEFSNADWRFLIRAAANTARAFAAIHETGCVIGDVNHGGVRVSDKATVRLIDCDSFQVSAGGRKFLCEVGVPTFTPPELQGKPFRGVVRSANHDNFGLAVLIFHLLYMGRHPFAGRFLGRGDMSIEQAIGEFRFAYGANRASVQMEPPPNVPSIAIASQPVMLLIERAFSREGLRDGVRPTAREWITALEGLEKQLKACHVNSSHHYLNGLDRCPWCHLEAATGVVLFNISIHRGPQVSGGDVAALWVRIAAVPSPGPAPTLSEYKAAPSPQAAAHGRAMTAKKVFGYGALIVALLALIGFAPQLLILWGIGGFVAWAKVSTWVSSGAEIGKFRDSARTAEDSRRAINTRWEQEATDHRFVTQLRQLEHERDQLRDLPHVRQRRYQELERTREHHQRRRYLERFEIERAKISGVGPGRKAMLESYNIETAWDVSESHIMRVPGFGPALTRELLKWRRGLEAKFKFDPTKGVDPQDIAALDREIADTKRKLEQNLANGPQTLTQIRNHTLAQRAMLKPLIDEVEKALAQAKADLKAVS